MITKWHGVVGYFCLNPCNEIVINFLPVIFATYWRFKKENAALGKGAKLKWHKLVYDVRCAKIVCWMTIKWCTVCVSNIEIGYIYNLLKTDVSFPQIISTITNKVFIYLQYNLYCLSKSDIHVHCVYLYYQSSTRVVYSFLNIFMGSHDVTVLFWYRLFRFHPSL